MAIFSAIGGVVAGTLFAVGTTAYAVTSAVVGAGLAFGARLALSYLNRPKSRTYSAVQGELQYGGSIAAGALFGKGKVKGQLAKYVKFGQGNEFNTKVLILSNGWCDGLEPHVYFYGEKHNLVELPITGNEVAHYGVEDFWYDDNPNNVNCFSIRFYDGRPGQQVDQKLVNDSANTGQPWESTSTLTGHCYVVLQVRYDGDNDLGKNGFPDIDWVLRGLRCYDWRKDSTVAGGSGTHRRDDPATWEFTENPAVQRFNYQMGLRGLISDRVLIGEGKSIGQMDLDSYTASANVCDEQRTVSGRTFNRYQCALYVTGDDDHTEVLSEFDDAMAGYALNRRGLSGVLAGAPQIPVATITEDDIRTDEGKVLQYRQSAYDLYNHMSGQFTSIEDQYEPASLDPIVVNADVLADGRFNQVANDFLQVTDPDIAQYLLQIRYRQQRLGGSVTVPVTWKFGFQVVEGEWVTWRGRDWIINEWRIDEAGRISLVLEETSADIYDESTIQPGPIIVPAPPPVNPALLSNVQDFTVEVGIVAAGEGGGQVPCLRFSWTPPNDPTITEVRVQYAPGSTAPDEPFEEVSRFPNRGELVTTKNVEGGHRYVARCTITTVPDRFKTFSQWIVTADTTDVRYADILDGSVTAEKIADAAIEASKLADEAVTERALAAEAVSETKLAVDAVSSRVIENGAVVEGKLADLAVTADKVAANAIVTAKIANGAVDQNKVADSAINAAKLASNAVTAVKLADEAVTAAKIGPLAVTAAKVAENAITTAKLVNGAVAETKLAVDAVSSRVIANDAVIEGKIADLAVTADKVAANAITTVKLANGAVAEAKLAVDAVSSRVIANGAVIEGKIADLAVTADKVAENAITTAKLVNGAVDQNKVADAAIVAAKLADDAVTHDKIVAGAIYGDKIAAGSITARELVLTDFSNIVPDNQMMTTWSSTKQEWGNYPNGSALWNSERIWRVFVSLPVTDGYFPPLDTPKFPVEPTKEYWVSYQQHKSVSSETAEIWTRIHWLDSAGQPLPGANEHTTLYNGSVGFVEKITANVTAPAGASTARIRWYVDGRVTTTNVSIGGVVGRRANDASLIVDGAISTVKLAANAVTAAKIAAGTITATEIASGAITTDELAANAVTAAKIAAGTITATEIASGAITTVKLDAGAVITEKLAANAVTAAKIAAGTITATEIASGAITTDELAANAVTAAKIAAGTITATVIASGAITTVKLGAGVVITDKLAANAVTAAKIAAGTITATEIASGAITTDRLAANAVTAAKIAAGTITATEIAGNTITGDKFVSNTITARELILTDYENLVANGNFEEPNYSKYWTTGGGSGNYVILDNPGYVKTGKYSFLIQKAPDLTQQFATNVQSFAVSGDGDYYAETEIRTNIGSSPDGFRATIYWFTPDLSLISSEDIVFNAAIPQQWQIYSKIVKAPSNASFAQVRLYNLTGSTTQNLIVDRIVVRKANAANLIVDGAISAAKIATGAVTAGKIAANAVTATEIASGAISTIKLASNAVTAAKIAAGTITATEIASGAITTVKLGAGVVTAEKLQSGSVTTEKIAAGSITGEKIVANAITARELILTDFENLVLNGSFNKGTIDGWYDFPSNWSIIENDGSSSVLDTRPTRYVVKMPVDITANAVMRTGGDIPVQPGDKLLIACKWARNFGAGDVSFRVRVRYADRNGVDISSYSEINETGNGSWKSATNVVTVPAEAASIARIEVFNIGTAGGFSGILYMTDITVKKQKNANLIVDGAITAAKLSVNSLSAIAANVGELTAGVIRSSNNKIRFDLSNGVLTMDD